MEDLAVRPILSVCPMPLRDLLPTRSVWPIPRRLPMSVMRTSEGSFWVGTALELVQPMMVFSLFLFCFGSVCCFYFLALRETNQPMPVLIHIS